MTERNAERWRLIELLGPLDSILIRASLESVADHLLANGVVVPPVKVGDILFLPLDKEVIVYEVTKIKYDGDLLKVVTHNKLNGLQRTIWAMDVGVTIFRTCEEAEKALEMMERG